MHVSYKLCLSCQRLLPCFKTYLQTRYLGYTAGEYRVAWRSCITACVHCLGLLSQNLASTRGCSGKQLQCLRTSTCCCADM